MEGILDMSKLLMELIAERLKQPHIPLILLHLLAIVCIHFNTDMYIYTVSTYGWYCVHCVSFPCYVGMECRQ